jgi:hypothetical protein
MHNNSLLEKIKQGSGHLAEKCLDAHREGNSTEVISNKETGLHVVMPSGMVLPVHEGHTACNFDSTVRKENGVCELPKLKWSTDCYKYHYYGGNTIKFVLYSMLKGKGKVS